MDIKDLKSGIIYQTYWGDPNKPTILTLREDGNQQLLHYIYEGRMFKFNAMASHLNGSHHNITLATLEQKQWYNACVKAEKFVEFRNVKFKITHELWM
jgi:hypothetical protein